jgi:hypothetical protein
VAVDVQNVCHGAGMSAVDSSEKRECSVDTVHAGGTEPSDHSDRPVGKVAAGLLCAFGAE